MRSASARAAALGAASLLLCAGCGSAAPAVLKTSSSPRMPDWALKAPPRGGGDIYFVGSIANQDSLDDGKQAALNKARAQAAEYLGVQITAIQDILESSDVGENRNRDSVKARTAAIIKGATVEDVYYEKLSRQAGATSIDKYDVWVLAKLSRADLESEKQRQQSEAKINLQNAAAWLREGKSLEQQGDTVAALARYRKAQDAMTGIVNATETGEADYPNAGRLSQALSDAAGGAKAKARRAVIVGPASAASALSEALSKAGFTTRLGGSDENHGLEIARNDGTPYVIVAIGRTTPGGHVFNQVAATVALDVRALEAKSGAVVASLQKNAKEVRRTPEAAADAAAHTAGLEAGKDLAGQLVKKETAAE